MLSSMYRIYSYRDPGVWIKSTVKIEQDMEDYNFVYDTSFQVGMSVKVLKDGSTMYITEIY